MKRLIRRTGFILLAFIILITGALDVFAEQETDAQTASEANEIIVRRAMRLAFLGQAEGGASWTPRYSFHACNSDWKYIAGQTETSMPYSRSALFNGTEFEGMQNYIGYISADTGAAASYGNTVTYFLRIANTPGSVFDNAARSAVALGSRWGALLGSDCSSFLSYAWQIPHMTTYMLTTDAVAWNICRIVPPTRGHEGHFTAEDISNLEPGDAMICCNRSGTDENGNPIYRGHCVIITAIRTDINGRIVSVDTVEEIAPRAVFKSRSLNEFIWYANKLQSSGAYYKFYRLVSKRHLKLEIELVFDSNGGDPIPDEMSVKTVFVRDAFGNRNTYDGVLNLIHPTRQGYLFMGWGLNPKDDNVITSGTEIELMLDHTLYAKWQKFE